MAEFHRNHVIDNFTAYNNGLGIFHGAYANSYTYNRGYLYANGIKIKAASVNSNRVRIENITIDGANVVDYLIRVIESPLAGEVPILLRNLTLKGQTKAAISDEVPEFLKSIDVVGCTITGTGFYISPSASRAGSYPRSARQRKHRENHKKPERARSQSLHPTFWGDGSGLTAQYFNSTDFTKPAFTRVDSNISFTEWAAGVHYAITSNTYSVRWTGQIQAQGFRGTYFFSRVRWSATVMDKR